MEPLVPEEADNVEAGYGPQEPDDSLAKSSAPKSSSGIVGRWRSHGNEQEREVTAGRVGKKEGRSAVAIMSRCGLH